MRIAAYFLFIGMIAFSACKSDNSTSETQQDSSTESNESEVYTPEEADYSGTWELDFINGEKTSLEMIYPNKRPTINFNADMTQISGSTSCVPYKTNIVVKGTGISIQQPRQELKDCEGPGDNLFLEVLPAITHFNVDGNLLNLNAKGMIMMRFRRKTN